MRRLDVDCRPIWGAGWDDRGPARDGHACFSSPSARAEPRFEDGCDEFRGRRGSQLMIPKATNPAMDSRRERSSPEGGRRDA
jgi:hypothetical protein